MESRATASRTTCRHHRNRHTTANLVTHQSDTESPEVSEPSSHDVAAAACLELALAEARPHRSHRRGVGDRFAGLGHWPSYVLPTPQTVARELVDVVKTGHFWTSLETSLSRAVTGYALALVVGTAFGFAAVQSRLFRRIFGPLVTGTRTMPPYRLVPARHPAVRLDLPGGPVRRGIRRLSVHRRRHHHFLHPTSRDGHLPAGSAARLDRRLGKPDRLRAHQLRTRHLIDRR